MNVLVCGGAGYIGSHCTRILAQNGHSPVVYDNLVAGHREAVGSFPFYEGDIADVGKVAHVLGKEKIDAVMHYAGFTYVGESMEDPRKYYWNNLVSTVNLLNAICDAGVGIFIFSSSASTYGVPSTPVLDESHPQNPINPYGATKHMVERILRDYDRSYGLRHVSLRYFNAAGADPSGEIGEDHSPETHLIPIALEVALGKRPHVNIFGTDYATEDGTCIRDYIHVCDLAHAHVLAMQYLANGGESTALNLGTEDGASVQDVIRVAQLVTGAPIPARESPRRAGDPDRLVASSGKARELLGWRPRFSDLEGIVSSAWRWHSSRPNGFTK